MSAPAKFAGITKFDCASACNVNGCVIAAGRPHCLHPLKGAMPEHFRNDPAIQQLYHEACTALGIIPETTEGIGT